jgi:hypothetical protein
VKPLLRSDLLSYPAIRFSQPSVKACIYTLIELKAFQKWVEAGDGVRNSEDLSALLACDRVLLSMTAFLR